MSDSPEPRSGADSAGAGPVGEREEPARSAPPVPSFTTVDNGITFLMVCAGGPAAATIDRIRREQALDRQVVVFPTPTAADWLDGGAVAGLTGFPMRSAMPGPADPAWGPVGHRVLVSPCTLNSLTKWAHGHADNLALSLLCEAIGSPGIEIRAELSLSGPYANHPATTDALAVLRTAGVHLAPIDR